MYFLRSFPRFAMRSPLIRFKKIALRVVVELPNWEFHMIGTAVFIAGNLAVTARHVLEAVIRNFGVSKTEGVSEVSEYSLRLYQVIA